LAPSELRQVTRQIDCGGHRGSRDERGNYRNTATERCRDLHSNEVLRIVESATATGVRRAQPVPADHRDKRITGTHRSLETVDEVLPRSDCIDVDEHIVGAEVISQPIRQSAGVRRAVLAPVTDEDLLRLAADAEDALLLPASSRPWRLAPAKPGLKNAWRSGVKFLDLAPFSARLLTVLDDMHPGM
jgi:hypothetical protein